nr:reverse transcriptase domain-containing protein [Tanacetum cinerariifolium]
RIWLDKEPPRSILTWEDLVSKFINQFFPPSKTTYLRNEITNFLQKSNETFNEAWERLKDLLRQCPHHGFSELHQLDTPHNHLRFFNKVTSTFRHPKVPNTTVKLLLFPFSLEGEARIWLDKEPPRSILTWEDSSINSFPLPKQLICVTKSPIFFKNIMKPSTKPGNVLRTYSISDAIDSAAGGNFLDKIPRECLSIIESKSKVRYSRSRVTNIRTNANANLSSQSNSFDLQQITAALEDKLDIRMNRFEKSLIDMKNSLITPTAPIKAVMEICVTYGSNHSYNQCLLTRGGNDYLVFHDNIQQFQTTAV